MNNEARRQIKCYGPIKPDFIQSKFGSGQERNLGIQVLFALLPRGLTPLFWLRLMFLHETPKSKVPYQRVTQVVKARLWGSLKQGRSGSPKRSISVKIRFSLVFPLGITPFPMICLSLKRPDRASLPSCHMPLTFP
jgi:hypothetical protein